MSSAQKVKYKPLRDSLRGLWHGQGGQGGFPEEGILELRLQTKVGVSKMSVIVEGEEQEMCHR